MQRPDVTSEHPFRRNDPRTSGYRVWVYTFLVIPPFFIGESVSRGGEGIILYLATTFKPVNFKGTKVVVSWANSRLSAESRHSGSGREKPKIRGY